MIDYTYFCSFQHKKKVAGVGACVVKITQEVTSAEGLVELIRAIEENYQHANVIPIYFKLLKTEEY